MAHESRVIDREEGRESGDGERPDRPRLTSIADAQEEMEETFLVVGAVALALALAGAYLIAARTPGPATSAAAR